MDWVAAISSVGFPIVACIGLAFYVKYLTDRYREEVKELQKEHKEEISKMTEALDRNTDAVEKLIITLGGKDENSSMGFKSGSTNGYR